jgi:hypothetical protein
VYTSAMRLSSWTNPRRDDREHEVKTILIFFQIRVGIRDRGHGIGDRGHGTGDRGHGIRDRGHGIEITDMV